MAKNTPSLYSISKTFVWFAIVSILLTGSLIAVVWLDSAREWKDYQKHFTALKRDKAASALKEADQNIDKTKLDDLAKRHAQAAADIRAHRQELDHLRKNSSRLDTRIAKIKAKTQDLKQFFDSYRYYFEEYEQHNDKRSVQAAQKMKQAGSKLDASKNVLENLEKEKEAKEAEILKLLTGEKDLKREMDKLTAEKTRVQKLMDTLKPSIATDVLNAPMLDFIAPSLEIQQIVLEDLYDDYHFARVQKVDRCTTCHLGIDQKGFENAPQPYRTHPKLELYLGSSSSHPIEKFGCTVCHGGNGHSVSFKDSAHMPQSADQKKEWEKKYRWEPLEKWEHKMLPLRHVEAACAKCHHGTVEVPEAKKLNQGRQLAREFGCVNCHKIAGNENHWKAGPDLGHLRSKLDEKWLVRWLDNPKDFRPESKMPRIFHLSNTSSPEDIEKNHAAIRSIAQYLLKNSGAVELDKPPVPGDALRGEKLVKDLGCLGCHNAAGMKGDGRAPDLTGLGSKVGKDWLYTWVKNPKHISPNTRMPNLRLSDQEASDITSFLLSQTNEAFDKKPLPEAKPEVVDGMILAQLQSSMRRQDAEAELERMSGEEKMQFLGKKSIAHQGCFSCHAIHGFEDAKPIGAELTNEGAKDLHQFDFGFVHDIEHTRDAWVSQKLKEPRIFDHGKVKDYYDRLRMPQFDFSEDQIDALTTFVLSLNEERIPLEMQKRLDLNEKSVEAGRALIAKYNCTGCHALDGHPGTLREMAEDLGSAPPILDGEGAKVQEKWLHEFLNHPTPIRPWLTVRMPTFGFSDEELSTLVHYFDHAAGQEMSYKMDLPPTTPEKLAAGQQLFDTLQCVKCHQVTTETAAMGTSFLAPDLTLTKQRLKADWVHRWIADPQTLESGTMMPTFFSEGQSPVPDLLEGDAAKQIEAIRDYLYVYEKENSVAK